MKKLIFILAIAGFIFSSCGDKKKKDNAGTHVHEDGTVHSNHTHDDEVKPNQESFEVKEEHHHEGEAKEEHSNDHEHSHGAGEGQHTHN